MGLAADRAVACDLADVVDSIGFPQHPAAVRWDELVQILHFAAIGGNESVIDVAGGWSRSLPRCRCC